MSLGCCMVPVNHDRGLVALDCWLIGRRLVVLLLWIGLVAGRDVACLLAMVAKVELER